MKTIALGDTHGETLWKKIVEKESPDRVVFIGDYFDSRRRIGAQNEIDNFHDIIEYKITSGVDVKLLIGNHDFHYMPACTESYSGFQFGAYHAIQRALVENIEHLQMAHLQDNMLFTHAGVSTTWLYNSLGFDPRKKEEYLDVHGTTPIDVLINEIFKYTPKHFLFDGYEETGDDVTQSPIWIRPRSLANDMFGNYTQVVGHTTHRSLMYHTDCNIYFIDVLGTSKEYLIIEDGKISVGILR